MKSTCRYPSVQPLWQREFLQWLIQFRPHFAVPVSIIRRCGDSFELCFPSLPASARQALRVGVRKNGVSVGVIMRNHCCDFLLDLDAYPKRLAHGMYTDPWLAPEYQRNYDSMFELRRHLLYVPFLDWVNQSLATARWLGVYRQVRAGDEIGSSYARLLGKAWHLDIRTHPEAALFNGLMRWDKTSARHDPDDWQQTLLDLRPMTAASDLH